MSSREWMASGNSGDLQVVEQPDRSPFLAFGLSWVVYVSMLWTAIMRVMVLAVAGVFMRQVMIWMTGKTMDWIVLAAVILAVVSLVYDFLYFRSVVLYTDIVGVWLGSGVFPWQKASLVIKWRDLGEVTFETGFFSWILRSYTVRVRSRFNGGELHMPNIRWGNLAVQHIQRIAASLTRIGHIS